MFDALTGLGFGAPIEDQIRAADAVILDGRTVWRRSHTVPPAVTLTMYSQTEAEWESLSALIHRLKRDQGKT